jgi:hypothetical protein
LTPIYQNNLKRKKNKFEAKKKKKFYFKKTFLKHKKKHLITAKAIKIAKIKRKQGILVLFLIVIP